MRTRSDGIRAITIDGKEVVLLKDDDELIKFGIEDVYNRVMKKEDNDKRIITNQNNQDGFQVESQNHQLISPISTADVFCSANSVSSHETLIDNINSTPPRSRCSSVTNTDRLGRTKLTSTPSNASRSTSSSRASSPRPKNHVCDFPGCTKAYSRPSLLEQHLRSHYGYRPFKCPGDGCTEAFTRKDHLKRHMLKHTEEKDKPFHCSVCKKGVNSLQHLKRHEKIHFKSFECTFEGCFESFHKHQSLKAHIRAVHDVNNSAHICQFCNKQFNRPGRLTDHIEKHHSETSKLICDFSGCYKTFRVWSALQLHIKTDHPRLECEICGKKCVGPSGLANHMKIHNETTVIKLWKCSECFQKFQRKEDTVRHYAEEHPRIELPEELRYYFKEDKLEKNERKKPEIKPLEYYIHKKEEEKKRKRFEREIEERKQCKLNEEKEQSNGNNSNIDTYDDYNNTSLTDFGFIISKPTLNNFKKHQLNRAASSPDVLDLIIDNVEQRLECPYTNCHRLFRKDYDLNRHLIWHKKQDELLDNKVESILSEFDYDSDGNVVGSPKYVGTKE
jgi:uncharacterized Zn-finger protein